MPRREPMGASIPGAMSGTPPLCLFRISGRKMRGPDDVDAHPAGASPFGVMDLVGNVWQWTDEYRRRAHAGRHPSWRQYYQPQGSIWYFPQAYGMTEHGKLLLMAPSYDRSGGVGFRCVKDAE